MRILTAIEQKSLANLERMTKFGALNMNFRDTFGRTPLMVACMEPAPHIVQLLLELLASRMITDCSGRTALHILFSHSGIQWKPIKSRSSHTQHLLPPAYNTNFRKTGEAMLSRICLDKIFGVNGLLHFEQQRFKTDPNLTDLFFVGFDNLLVDEKTTIAKASHKVGEEQGATRPLSKMLTKKTLELMEHQYHMANGVQVLEKPVISQHIAQLLVQDRSGCTPIHAALLLLSNTKDAEAKIVIEDLVDLMFGLLRDCYGLLKTPHFIYPKENVIRDFHSGLSPSRLDLLVRGDQFDAIARGDTRRMKWLQEVFEMDNTICLSMLTGIEGMRKIKPVIWVDFIQTELSGAENSKSFKRIEQWFKKLSERHTTRPTFSEDFTKNRLTSNQQLNTQWWPRWSNKEIVDSHHQEYEEKKNDNDNARTEVLVGQTNKSKTEKVDFTKDVWCFSYGFVRPMNVQLYITGLHEACRYGKLEVVQFIIQEINCSDQVLLARDPQGNTLVPLFIACFLFCFIIIK